MLLISDLHFTDKAADAYRFEIFDWVRRHYKRTRDKNLLILGDLTDSKDHHSAALVNRIVNGLLMLTDLGMEVFVLKGNHDYIDPLTPYFKFIDNFEYVTYITSPKAMLIEGNVCLFLPHSRNPIEDWKKSKLVREYTTSAEYVFMHESVLGSVTSSGYEMEVGLPPSYFKKFTGEVISGDIHCPQTIGPVTYVGTPYSIRYNDHYRGRALQILPDALVKELYPDIRGRWTVDVDSVRGFMDAIIELPTNVGDQVKVRYQLANVDRIHWDDIKKKLYMACKNLHVEIATVQIMRPERFPLRGRKRNELKEALQTLAPGEVVSRFSKQHGIDKARQRAGRKIVGE